MTAPPPIPNRVQQRLAAGELALGLIVRLVRGSEIALVAAASDHDFVFIDAQHAPFGPSEIAAVIEGALAQGIAPIVRVRGCDDPNLSLYLDAGALGLLVPNVDDAAQAARAVEAAKFPPIGRRSHPGPLRLFDYATAPAAALGRINAATLLIPMIESQAGVRDAEAIADVPGVDGLHVGAVDLLSDMPAGLTMDHPDFIAAIDHVIAAALGAKKFAGIGGEREPERLRRYIAAGARFLTTQIDLSLLLEAAGRRTAALRALHGAAVD